MFEKHEDRMVVWANIIYYGKSRKSLGSMTRHGAASAGATLLVSSGHNSFEDGITDLLFINTHHSTRKELFDKPGNCTGL